jgi:hypothetical protein
VEVAAATRYWRSQPLAGAAASEISTPNYVLLFELHPEKMNFESAK